MDERFASLTRVKHSDNTCSVGWTNIHAFGWWLDVMEAALEYCPEGNFTPTGHKDSLSTGSYFAFPMDENAGRFMVAIGLTDELLRLRANGGRHHWPRERQT